MGKRSNFERVERDFYPTPRAAVLPLIPHLPKQFEYWEPCAGAADLAYHLSELTDSTFYLSDIEPQDERMRQLDCFDAKYLDRGLSLIITNPPWERNFLHRAIPHFSGMRPTWLLLDADWVHTKQSAPFMPRLRKVVSVGRVKWVPDSKMTGKDNCAWHLFDKPSDETTQFYGRTS